MGSCSCNVFCLDTNSLLDDPCIIEKLLKQDGVQVKIPYHVILELDKLKSKSHLRDRITDIVKSIEENYENIGVLKSPDTYDTPLFTGTVDTTIINEIKECGSKEFTLISNDRIMRLLARIDGINSIGTHVVETGQSISEKNTGFFTDPANPIINGFMWVDGKPVYYKADGTQKCISYQNEVWKLEPRSVYQNLAMELLLDQKIDLLTLQSPAGYGKTLCALAAAFYLTFEKKLFDKIYIVKATQEVDASLGFLPGTLEDKIKPYFSYLDDLVLKLHELRPVNRIFNNPKEPAQGYDRKKFETVPIQFLRGKNIDNAFVIIDETQNISRHGVRTLLTRMGENVKCTCLGDVRQIDNENLNSHDNGLTWIVKKCLGAHNFAHFVMKGQRSRGPITDLVLATEL